MSVLECEALFDCEPAAKKGKEKIHNTEGVVPKQSNALSDTGIVDMSSKKAKI